MKQKTAITRAELARQLGVSRAYVTMLCNGNRKPSKRIVNKLHSMDVNNSDTMSGLKIRVSPVRFWASALYDISLPDVLSLMTFLTCYPERNRFLLFFRRQVTRCQ
jgi:transcriptional regulator with XRE-family HTH domain